MRLFRGRSPTLVVSLLVGVAVVLCLVQVYSRLQVIHLGYDLSRETKLHHDLVEQNHKLRLELAVRKDPAVIERRARQELRMAPPDPRAIRVIDWAHGRYGLPPAAGVTPPSDGGAEGRP